MHFRALFSASPLAAAILCLTLSGCSQFGVYRIDIQQGNLITQDQLSKVRPGMSRLDVRNVLGTPLLQDVFNANRWDYAFDLDRNSDRKLNPFGREQEKYRVSVHFENDKVARVEGAGPVQEIFIGGGERRSLPNTVPPNAPPDPKKQPQ